MIKRFLVFCGLDKLSGWVRLRLFLLVAFPTSCSTIFGTEAVERWTAADTATIEVIDHVETETDCGKCRDLRDGRRVCTMPSSGSAGTSSEAGD